MVWMREFQYFDKHRKSCFFVFFFSLRFNSIHFLNAHTHTHTHSLKHSFHFLLYTDLLPSDSQAPTLHLVAYSVNQKGRSEPFVLEDIAINEAEKRTGMSPFFILFFYSFNLFTFHIWYTVMQCEWKNFNFLRRRRRFRRSYTSVWKF